MCLVFYIQIVSFKTNQSYKHPQTTTNTPIKVCLLINKQPVYL